MAYPLPNAEINEIVEKNKKRQRAYNFLRFLTLFLLFGDLFGLPYIFGIPTFFIAIILLFSRGLIVNRIYGPPQRLPATAMGAPGQPGYYQAYQGMDQGAYPPPQNPQQTTFVYDGQPQKQTEPVIIAAEYKFCEMCGTQNDASARYCENCGEKMLE